MDKIYQISLIILWSVVFLELVLIFKIARWVSKLALATSMVSQKHSELTVGMAAPNFRAKTLTGETVRLATYDGHAVIFIFVSPGCGGCSRLLPVLEKLAPTAQKDFGVEIILVSDRSSTETSAWIDEYNKSNPGEWALSVLIAPRFENEFTAVYNPNAVYPYYCFVNKQGIVQSRDLIGKGEWPSLQQMWEDSTEPRFPSIVRRYT